MGPSFRTLPHVGQSWNNQLKRGGKYKGSRYSCLSDHGDFFYNLIFSKFQNCKIFIWVCDQYLCFHLAPSSRRWFSFLYGALSTGLSISSNLWCFSLSQSPDCLIISLQPNQRALAFFFGGSTAEADWRCSQMTHFSCNPFKIYKPQTDMYSNFFNTSATFFCSLAGLCSLWD